jgi:hypothetical protein
MAKYGLAGIIPGLLTPLGPIGGLMVGGAFGYLKNNEKFTNKYFGEEGKLTIGSKEKKIIEDMLPGAVKGAAAGAISTLLLPTPWGIMGNAVIGAAIGMMGSTEEFKNSILGQEINGVRVGGLANEIKDIFAPLKDSVKDLGTKLIEVVDKNIVDPIARFVTPAIHAIPQLASILPRKINEFIMNTKFGKKVSGFIHDNIITPMQGILTKIVTPIAKTAMNVITSPVRLLGWAGDKIRGMQIKTGNADYMTARERVEWMKQHGKGKKVSAVDRVLADIGTDDGMNVDTASKLSTDITSIISTEGEIVRSKKAQERTINKILNGYKTADGKALTKKAKEELRKAMEAGDMDRVRVVLSTYATQGGDTGLTKDQIEALMNGETGLGTELKKYMNIKDKENAIKNVNKEQIEGELGDLFDKLGIDRDKIKDRHFMAKFAKNLETEVLDRQANETGKGEASLETENNEIFKHVAAKVTNIEELLKAIATGNTEGLKNLNLKHKEDYENFEAALDSDYKARSENTSLHIGKDMYDKFNEQTKDYLNAGSKGKINKNKATKINRDKELIIKYKMTVEQVNACNGKVLRLSKLMKEGYKVDPEAAGMLNGLTDSEFSRVTKFISSNYIRKMLIVRTITKDDINFFVDNYTQLKLIENKCEYLLKNEGYDPKQFESFDEVMSDRAEAGKEANPAESLSTKIKRSIKGVTDFIFKGDSEEQEEEKPETERNGIGTFLLGAGSSLLKGAGSLIGKAGSAVSSLFKNKDKDGEEAANMNAGILSTLFAGTKNASKSSGGDTDEVDKAGDGRDVLPLGDGYGLFRRDSSGNVQPDTTDSHTKSLLNKLELKEKFTTKLQEAQLKASEIITNTFGGAKEKESGGGKLGWLGLLLTGGYLWKSGILGKIFDGVIKPIWTNNIKPWITDTAVPWISDKWNNIVKPWLLDEALPAIGNFIKLGITGLIELLPEILGSAVGTLVKELPTVISTAVKVALNIGDAVTGNKYNAGGSTEVSGKELAEKYGEYFETGMRDENGKFLTAGDIASGNYDKIYNDQGVEADIDENGNITFKDESKVGASYANTTIGAGIRSFAKSMATGRKGLLTTAASKVTNFLTKRKNPIVKLLGHSGNMVVKPIQGFENLGIKARGSLNTRIDDIAKKLFKEAREGDIVDRDTINAIRNGDGSKLSEFLKKFGDATDNDPVRKATDKVSDLKSKFTNFFKRGAKEASEEATEKAAKNTIKSGGIKLPEFLKKFGNNADKDSLDKASNLKDKFTNLFKKGAKETTEEAAEKTVKKAAKKVSEVDGFLPKILEKAKSAISSLFKDSTVYKKLTDAAEALGAKNPGKWIKNLKNNIDNIFNEALEKGIKKAGLSTCKKVASKLLAVVFLVTDFLTGCDQAESILGVKQTSIIEEVVAGLINSLCNFLIIPSIWPGTNWVAQKIFGFIDEKFKERQDEATKEYEEYKETHGSTLTQEEYLKRQNSVTGKVGGWVVDGAKAAWNGTKAAGKAVGDGAKAAGNWIADRAKSVGNWFGFGTGTKYGRGTYSKQNDPSIAGMRFNTYGDTEHQTIGDSGCGPAAAVNAIESMYGRGNRIASAAKFALNHGYKEINGGTKPGFFTDYFNSNGLGSSTSYNKSEIARNIMNGMPTVIMGKDARGTSSSTPFGKTPHYVTVTGMDGKGNAIVQDPESRYDNQLYPLNSLMKNTSLGVSAYGRGKWGRGIPDNDITKQVWAFFTSKENGISPAATAGILGNMYAESNVNPTTIQSNGKGPAAGIVQWENYNTKSGRWKAMADYAASRGKDWTDLDSQLNYIMKEFTNGATYWNKGEKAFNNAGAKFTSFDEWRQSNDVDMATRQFEAAFERAGKPVIAKRVNAANEYYKLYYDKNYTYTGIIDDNSTNTSGDNSTQDDSSSSGGLLSEFFSKLGSVLSNSTAGKALGLFNDSSSSDSSTQDNGTSDGTYTEAAGDAATVVNIAKGEVGTKENGTNYVKYNDWYWGDGKGGPDYPWCAAFTSWVANQAGVPTSIIPKTASTKQSYSGLINNGGKVSNSEARPGDYIFFTDNGASSGIYHTGIVTGYSNGTIGTIEGNSSDAVRERSYSASNSKILIARPKYANTGTTSGFVPNKPEVSDAPEYSNTRGSNGIKPLSRYGQFKDSIYGRGTAGVKTMHNSKDGYDKVEVHPADIKLGNAMKLASRKNLSMGKGTSRYGMAGALDYSNLINAIINILMTIADNTDKLNLIVSILNNKLNLNISASDVSNATTDTQSLKSKLSSALNGINNASMSKFNTYADNVADSSINSIILAMNAIASE